MLGLLEAVPGIKGSQSRGARGWMDGSTVQLRARPFISQAGGWFVGPSCRVTPNQCSLQGEEKAGQIEGGVVFATKKLHAAGQPFSQFSGH